jgi:NAD(P)-dependent dehydrogenase (short-subunit alcohol dehydrogenase family)
MMHRTVDEFGTLDVLVNNAGNEGANPSSAAPKPFWETSPEDWQRWLGVNLFGVIACVTAATPYMVKQQRWPRRSKIDGRAALQASCSQKGVPSAGCFANGGCGMMASHIGPTSIFFGTSILIRQ